MFKAQISELKVQGRGLKGIIVYLVYLVRSIYLVDRVDWV